MPDAGITGMPPERTVYIRQDSSRCYPKVRWKDMKENIPCRDGEAQCHDLIYSDLRLNPSSGKVRVALTVPIRLPERSIRSAMQVDSDPSCSRKQKAKETLKTYDKLVNGSHCASKRRDSRVSAKVKSVSPEGPQCRETTFIVTSRNRNAPVTGRDLRAPSVGSLPISCRDARGGLTIANPHAILAMPDSFTGQRYGGDTSRKNSSNLRKGESIAASKGASCNSTPETLRGSPSKPRKARTLVKDTLVKKSLNRTPDSDTQKGASSSIYSRVSHKTSSVSPAPPRAHEPLANRFGFSPTVPTKSGDSTDSLNSILSDVITTSDSNFNLCDIEDANGNHKSRSRPVSDVISESSSCTISQASSGVTTAVLNSRLKAHTRQLPKPQIVNPLARNLAAPKKTPQREAHPKIKTTDSGFASASECEKTISDFPSDLETPKLDLDVSDAWLHEKHAFLGNNAHPVKGKMENNSVVRRTDVGKEKQSIITYGMARQKLAPYNRKRFGFIGPSLASEQTPSSPKITTGSVKSRIAQLENTPKTTHARPNAPSVRKPNTRPVVDNRTPGESNKTSKTDSKTHRKLDYSENRKLARGKKPESPKNQRPLSSGGTIGSNRVKAQSSSSSETDKPIKPKHSTQNSKEINDRKLVSSKSPESDSSFVLLSPESSSEILDQITPMPNVCAKAETDRTKGSSGLDVSSESSKSTSCDRLTSGKCTPVMGSTRGENDQDFFDDEISDQPGLTFGDALDVSLFDDEVLFPDEPVSSPSRRSKKTGVSRSRAESACTSSSFGADDLMLDYDPDDQKTSLGCSANDTTCDTQKTALQVLISGGRYDEPVKSPVVSDVMTELSTMIAEHTENQLPFDGCVSRESFCLPPSHAGPATQSPAHSNASRTASAPVKSRPNSTTSDHIVFKPPRQSGSDSEESIHVDRNTFHYITQDITSVKTHLLRLKRLLQATDDTNPFEQTMNPYFMNVGLSSTTSPSDILQENVSLRKQVKQLQQQMAEKERSMRALEQKLSQCMQPSLGVSSQSTCMQCSSSSSSDGSSCSLNAATQTDRSSHGLSHLDGLLSRQSSGDDGLGPVISSDVCKMGYTNGDLLKKNSTNGLLSETSSCLVSSSSSSSS